MIQVFCPLLDTNLTSSKPTNSHNLWCILISFSKLCILLKSEVFYTFCRISFSPHACHVSQPSNIPSFQNNHNNMYKLLRSSIHYSLPSLSCDMSIVSSKMSSLQNAATASSFKFQYLLFFLCPLNSCLYLLHNLPIPSTSVTKVFWKAAPMQKEMNPLPFHHFIVCRMFFPP